MKKTNIIMKKISILLLLGAILASVFTSCEYRINAEADYPANSIYQPLALDGVLYVDEAPVEDLGLPTEGAPVPYYLDTERNKLIINMGVVQSGTELKSFPVKVDVNFSAVNKLIQDGTFDLSVQHLPQAVYSLPETVMMSSDVAGTAFQLEIGANIFKSDEYYGKKFALAVSVWSDQVHVTPELSTVVIYLDPSFLVD